jgi:hypothetical protein
VKTGESWIFPLDKVGEMCYNIFVNKNGGKIMEEILSGEVENFEEVIEHWLEYGMALPVVHEHAVNLVPACIKALEEVNAYRIHTLIKLPIGITTEDDNGNPTDMSPSGAIIYRFQLTDWLRKDWNAEDYKKEQKIREIK